MTGPLGVSGACRVPGAGCRVPGAGCRVRGVGCRGWGVTGGHSSGWPSCPQLRGRAQAPAGFCDAGQHGPRTA
ncbi:hypothetical protein VT50_0227575 [Streptomyces antioxidans]|uniref:Uncharacterized protein n=1 Tax=Streptomyces antioxidans TaxID=1507734 RepID=A0A1V4CYJ4_9ACTN|nr:hypothetical protein VT50_0227575 [Streptomyces antioxidans]